MSLTKLDACRTCRLATVSCGWVPDTTPSCAKVAVVLPSATKDAILADKHWFNRRLLEGSGLSLDDLLLMAAVRCHVPEAHQTPSNLRHALAVCRQYDQAIAAFNPNWAIVTVDLVDMRKTPAFRNFVRSDFRKAHSLYTRGFRPVVLMGESAIRLVLPWATGIKWRGHHCAINGWPFTPKEELPPWEGAA